MGTYKIENGVVDLGSLKLPVPDTVSPEAQVYLSANPWGPEADAAPSVPMWETRESTAAAFEMLNDWALSLWPCDVEEMQIGGVRCHKIDRKEALPGAAEPELLSTLAVDADWLRTIPGRTVAAIKLALAMSDSVDARAVLAAGRRWFGGRPVVASRIGRDGDAYAITDFCLLASGFERMLVIAPADTSPTRAGRISQRLLEIETYRLMALRGLPVAKALASMLHEAEAVLARITARLEDAQSSDQELLNTLIELAARVERATAEHGYRFSATQAYDALVRQRINELREQAIAGTPTIGEFMQRRLSPAIATVAATAQRLASLSQRIERAGALLRTRVDIAREAQNLELLAKLTRGQELQLRLQSTVEGLSIAAISYYVVSLSLYAAKAAKAAGLPLNPELASGALVPLVVWAVWRTTRRIHQHLQRAG